MASTKLKYVIFAGPNGVGKSTLYHSLPEIYDMPRVNTDEIAKILGDWRSFSTMVQAGRKAIQIQKDCLEQKISFNQETTLCGHKIIKAISAAKERGFFIDVHFISVESDQICKQRIAHRVSIGGHDIPEHDIERRYKQSIIQMKSILPLCDKVTFYDNSNQLSIIAEFSTHTMTCLTNPLPFWFEKYFLS